MFRTNKKLFFTAAAAVFVALAAETAGWGTLFFLEKVRGVRYNPVPAYSLTADQREILNRFLAGDFYLKFSAPLGWTVRPDSVMRFRGIDEASVFARSNSRGIRSDREYAAAAPEGVLRLAAFGDSFTHANDVRNGETWTALLEKTDPGIEVLNFGVPAYGTDQAYLRYIEEGRSFRPRIVLIGYFTENMIRTVNVFRPFLYAEDYLPLAKPRFVLQAGRLAPVENPFRTLADYRALLDSPRATLARLGEHDYFFKTRYSAGPFDFLSSVRLAKMARYSLRENFPVHNEMFGAFYRPETEPFRVALKILETFYDKVLEDASLPVIVLFPSQFDVYHYPEKRRRTYDLLIERLKEKGLRFVDTMDGFIPAGYRDAFFASQGHYSAEGQRIVADTVRGYLQNRGFLNPRVVDSAVQAERGHRGFLGAAGTKGGGRT